MELRSHRLTELVGREKPFALQAERRIARFSGRHRIRPGASRDEDRSSWSSNWVRVRRRPIGLSAPFKPNGARRTELVGFDLGRGLVFNQPDPLTERAFELIWVQTVGGTFDQRTTIDHRDAAPSVEQRPEVGPSPTRSGFCTFGADGAAMRDELFSDRLIFRRSVGRWV